MKRTGRKVILLSLICLPHAAPPDLASLVRGRTEPCSFPLAAPTAPCCRALVPRVFPAPHFSLGSVYLGLSCMESEPAGLWSCSNHTSPVHPGLRGYGLPLLYWRLDLGPAGLTSVPRLEETHQGPPIRKRDKQEEEYYHPLL